MQIWKKSSNKFTNVAISQIIDEFFAPKNPSLVALHSNWSGRRSALVHRQGGAVLQLAQLEDQRRKFKKIAKGAELIQPESKMAFNCDFDAPMYVDFENLEGDGHAADDFFGKAIDQKLNFAI